MTTSDGVIAGNVIEISLQGGSVDTHPTPPPGTEVSVVLHAKTVERPVRIATAVVRWSRLGRFGLKFETIAPEDLARLREVVLTARGYSPEFVQLPPRRRRGGRTRWLAIAAATAAIAGTLALTLRF